MIYIFPSILILLSYLLGVYFAFQGQRSVIDKPLIYSNEFVLIILTVLFGWAPLIGGVYLAFNNVGLFFVLLLIITRFILLPPLFNNKIKSFMDKKQI